MTMSENAGPAARAAKVDKGLKPNAIGFWDGLAIGLDSTAPAYSLAAVLGSMVVIAGTKAPAVLIVSFIPMFLDRQRLPLHEPRRPGLRHDVLLGHPGDGPDAGVVGRLGRTSPPVCW